MQTSRRLSFTLAAVVVVGGAILLARDTAAEPPFPDLAIQQTSARVDYSIPLGVAAQVSSGAAIRTARLFTSAPEGATIRSVRLGLYSDKIDRGVPVWVVDVDGLRLEALGGPILSGTAQPTRIIRRAAVLVSAVEPDHVVAMFTLVLPPPAP